jgi:predicted nucleotidyltransferase
MTKITKKSLEKLGVLEEIEKYIDVLKINNIKPEKIILFGSLAKNKYQPYSDIDLAIVSFQFKKDVIEAMMTLSKLTIGVADRIEPIALTPEDLNRKYHSLIGEIKKYGKVIYSA